MAMTPEELVERLRRVLPSGLHSVILYGSAAAGDHVQKRSDYNVLVVAERLGVAELKALAPVSAAWARQGNPPPLLFTPERLRKSADVFPLEILDIKQSRTVLLGDDIIEGLEVSGANLRLELEHELKGKLIQLRERYLERGGKSRAVVELLVKSYSTFSVLFRGALRLFGADVPARKADVIQVLSRHIDFDADVFETVAALRVGEMRTRDVDPDVLFERYLRAVEQVVDAVDNHPYGGKNHE